MSVRHVDAIVVTAQDLMATVAFYRSLGVPLEEEEHGGPLHYACELGPVHFAVYQGSASTMIGFQVESLSASMTAAKSAGAKVMREPEKVPWGMRALFEDPDGRTVELNSSGE